MTRITKNGPIVAELKAGRTFQKGSEHQLHDAFIAISLERKKYDSNARKIFNGK